MNKALQSAIKKAGGQAGLARAISEETGDHIWQSHVRSWLTQNKKGVPAEYCPIIEKLTGVTREKLRPDVYT